MQIISFTIALSILHSHQLPLYPVPAHRHLANHDLFQTKKIANAHRLGIFPSSNKSHQIMPISSSSLKTIPLLPYSPWRTKPPKAHHAKRSALCQANSTIRIPKFHPHRTDPRTGVESPHQVPLRRAYVLFESLALPFTHENLERFWRRYCRSSNLGSPQFEVSGYGKKGKGRV